MKTFHIIAVGLGLASAAAKKVDPAPTQAPAKPDPNNPDIVRAGDVPTCKVANGHTIVSYSPSFHANFKCAHTGATCACTLHPTHKKGGCKEIVHTNGVSLQHAGDCTDTGKDAPTSKTSTPVWTLFENAVASKDGTVVTGTAGSWRNSHAVAKDALTGLGSSIKFRIPNSGKESIVGFECGEFDANAIYSPPSCLYFIYKNWLGPVYVKEKGTTFLKLSRPVNWDNDVWELRVNKEGFVEYLQNGVVFRTAAEKPTSFPLLVRSSFGPHSPRGTATDISITNMV